MEPILAALGRWRTVRVAVVGDYMLDQLVYGDAERLSPDAPVPVLAVRDTQNRPGGAANVCLDLIAMRAEVRAVGLVGDDAEGRLLRDALGGAGVGVGGVTTDAARPTTLKRSLIGLAQHRHPQKMFRMDVEVRSPVFGQAEAALVRAALEAVEWAEVVCIEDYNKGVCSPAVCAAVIERARALGRPVLVDPASIEDYSKYRGATCVTPNRTEAELAAGRPAPSGDGPDTLAPHWRALAHDLAARNDFEHVALTLDRHGALLLSRGRDAVHVPTVARKVYDVTGAGDMVLAALAAAVGNGVGWEDAVRFANAAAGLEVEIFGVEPIPLERIHHALLVDHNRLAGKSRTLAEAKIEAAAHRREGRKIVFTNGCFDLLHAGHIALLRHARTQGDVLIVGLNADESVRRLKGPERPVHNEKDRALVLGELASVDMVVVFEEDTPERLLRELRPDVLVKGGDYTVDKVVGREIVESYGGRIALAPMLEGRSTTGAIGKIRASRSEAVGT
ncbi:MAG: D-glycero-beta-D-manno-heptose 1-phosphate adenylyltransferase [Phycisphaerales bacterium]|nr:D-glycero-beta-D-manno-heptose 1-phosphate adenylyltransferase [Phycisphaerales bacterium]